MVMDAFKCGPARPSHALGGGFLAGCQHLWAPFILPGTRQVGSILLPLPRKLCNNSVTLPMTGWGNRTENSHPSLMGQFLRDS